MSESQDMPGREALLGELGDLAELLEVELLSLPDAAAFDAAVDILAVQPNLPSRKPSPPPPKAEIPVLDEVLEDDPDHSTVDHDALEAMVELLVERELDKVRERLRTELLERLLARLG